MIGLLQRVSAASVDVAHERIAEIGEGLLVLVGVERTDDEASARRLLERLLAFRVFGDEAGRMNRSLAQVAGGLLLVPQFTLVADTRKGTRPGFSRAAPPEQAERLFCFLCELAAARHASLGCGRFGADMRVSLVNEGPVTFSLHV